MELREPTRALQTTPRRLALVPTATTSSVSMATASSIASRRSAALLRAKSEKMEDQPSVVDKENRAVPPNNIGAGAGTNGGKQTLSKPATPLRDNKRPLERIYESVLDAKGNVTKCSYLKGRFLGKGGFASCYEVVCERTSRKYACKLVTKRSLMKPKARVKFKSEIKIHKALRHPNIVQFERYFEDDDNAYILLELCRNQSLSDLLRRRKRLSEAEVRFYIRQLVDGLAYLHKELVIHRDLKLGNLFLTADMKLKIGDFGLAAKLDHELDRKRTLCGTPNYIAPEILTGRTTTGHSFEVDIWSMGVVMYTLLVGKPPFETEDVKETYKRIRAGDFSFPDTVDISESAKSLVRSILRVEPHLRPSLSAIVAHPFFSDRPMLSSLPKTALLITPPECKRAIASNKRTMDALSYEPPPRYPLRRRDMNATGEREKEQGQAVVPVLVASPAPPCTPLKPVVALDKQEDNVAEQTTIILTKSNNSSGLGKSPRNTKHKSHHPDASRATTATSETAMPAPAPHDDDDGTEPMDDFEVKDTFDIVQETLSRFFYLEEHGNGEQRLDEFSSASVIVAAAKRVKEIRLEQEAARSQALEPASLWISQWVDYTSKYGMGYVLSDGSAGVYFNDSTKIISSSDGLTLEYMERVPELSEAPEPFVRYPADMYDPELKKKVTLLNHFKSYLIDERTRKTDIAAFDDQVKKLVAEKSKKRKAPDTPERMVFVKKWVKTKHAVLFCLSNHTFQFNFYDTSKLMLSSRGRTVTYQDKDGSLGVFSTAVAILNREPSDLAKRLRYAKDMFEQIARVNATVVAQGTE